MTARRRRLVAGVAGILAAALFTFVVTQARTSTPSGQPAAAAVATVPVVTATIDLTAGTKLTATNVGLRPYPVSGVIPNATLTSPTAAIDQYISVSVPAGSMILQSFLLPSPPAAGNTVTKAPLPLDPGTEAMSIPFDASKDVGGYIQPEDHLDILVSSSDGRLHYGFQDVRVLRVGDATGTAPAGAAAGTGDLVIELTPQKAATLAFLYSSNPGAVVRFVLRPRQGNNAGALPNTQPVGPSNWSQYLDG